MLPEHSPIQIAPDPTVGDTKVHHRDFPEIRACGRTPAEAAERLAQELTRALDSALTAWRRETIEKAIADAKAFAEQAGT
jgi:hypothetical protein